MQHVRSQQQLVVQVYVGADQLSTATLEAGMDGVIGGGGSSILAGMFVQIWHLFRQGKREEAQALQDRMNTWCARSAAQAYAICSTTACRVSSRSSRAGALWLPAWCLADITVRLSQYLCAAGRQPGSRLVCWTFQQARQACTWSCHR